MNVRSTASFSSSSSDSSTAVPNSLPVGSPRRSTTITKVGTKAAFSSSSSDSSTAVPNSLPVGSPRRSTTITKVGTKAAFSSSSSDSSTAVPNSLPMGSPRRSTTITKVGTKAAFSSSSSDSSTAVPNSLPMGSPRRSTTITKVGTTATFSSSSSDSSTAVPNSLPMGSPRRSTTITKVGTTATFSSSSSDSSTVVPKSLPMASVQPLSSNSARFHPKDFVSRVVPPTDYRQLELDVEDPNPSMPDGTTVRHYHTHNNNQTYNIYVTGGLAAAGLTKQAGQATDGSPDRSVLQKSPTHATLSSPNDGESFSKPNSHALQANPTSAFYSPPKRPGSVSFPLGRSDSATAVTASLDNNKESTTNISSDIILVGDSATVDTASLDNNKGNIKNIASDIVSADSTPSGVPTSTVHDDSTPSCVSTSKMNVSHARRRMSRTSRRKVVRYQPYPEQSQTPTHHGGVRDESNIQCYPVFDNNPTPQGDAEERELTEVEEREIQYNSFHEKYNKLMFNIDLDGNGLDGKPPIVPRCSQQLTNDSYEQLLEICFANQSGDEDRWRAVFHKYNTKIYDVIKNYHAKMLTNAEGEEVPRLYFGKRIAVPQRDVFAVIRDCHVSRSRHTKQNATSAIVRKMYCNITQKMVNTFIQMCPTCIRRPPVIKPLKGAASPIMSAAFRDRFQVDLIDMQDQATEDIRGVLCNFIVVLKDHFTRLSYCEPIPRKQPIFVAEVLCRIFGLICPQ